MLALPLVLPVRLPLSVRASATFVPSAGGGYPRLMATGATTDAMIGTVIGTIGLPVRWPRLVPSTTTDAAIGDIVGTIRI